VRDERGRERKSEGKRAKERGRERKTRKTKEQDSIAKVSFLQYLMIGRQ